MIVITLKNKQKIRCEYTLMALDDKFRFTNYDTKLSDFVRFEDIANIIEQKK